MKTLIPDILHILVLTLLSFLACLVIIPQIIKIARNRNFMDEPNWRSAHIKSTPSFGGISFIFPLILILIVMPINIEIFCLICSALLLSIIGLIDDLKDLKSGKKFLVQFLAANILFYGGFRLESLNGLFNIFDIPVLVSYGLTITLVVGIVNAFNLIDGIDGLAGGVGLINTVVFSIIFLCSGKTGLATVALTFSGSLLGFLRFNFNPAKIFMGDTGSLLIGVLMSAFFLKAFTIDQGNFSILSVGLVLLPCLDMARLFISRISNGVSPFKADNNHYHHLLIQSGDNHVTACLTCYFISFGLIALSFIIPVIVPENLELVCIIVAGIAIYALVKYKFCLKYRHEQNEASKRMNITIQNNHLLKKILS